MCIGDAHASQRCRKHSYVTCITKLHKNFRHLHFNFDHVKDFYSQMKVNEQNYICTFFVGR